MGSFTGIHQEPNGAFRVDGSGFPLDGWYCEGDEATKSLNEFLSNAVEIGVESADFAPRVNRGIFE